MATGNIDYLRTALSQIHERPTARPVDSRLKERLIKNVPQPAAQRPADSDFFVHTDSGERKPNLELLKRHFFHEGRLKEAHALYILEQAKEIFRREPNLVQVLSPVTICGDIHGQYYDLMKLFEVGGSLPQNPYLFLGDYVDRGCFGIECLLYLYTLKIWYPNKITLLRGNHECRHLTEFFTFKKECLHKYSGNVYEASIASFTSLPVAALVDDRFFCVHGGISPELNTLEDVRRINRFQEPGSQGLLCDLLWSDPIAKFGHEQEASGGTRGLAPGTLFLNNDTRGCSFFYTYEAACSFLDRNRLLGIIRGHEAQDVGYTMHRKTPTKKFPSVITIFSAPNYLDVYHNRGAILKYANRNITIRQFNSTSHPYWLPNFMDAFTWSLPFVGAKITDMLLAVLSVCSKEELEESDDRDTRTRVTTDETAAQAQREQMRNKIMAVSKMQRVFELLREEAENASEFMATESPHTGPSSAIDVLKVQGNQIRHNIRTFDDARRVDLANERRPSYTPSHTAFVPSMRRAEAMDLDYLIRKTLEEDEGGVVERLADRIASQRTVTGQPRPLRRFDTA